MTDGEEAPDSPDGPAGHADLRLLPPLVAGWATAGWATAHGAVAAAVMAAGCWALAVLVLGVTRRRDVRAAARPWSGPLVLVLAATGLVACATAARVAVRERPPFPSWTAERSVVEVAGTVLEDARAVRPVPGRQAGPRYVLRLAVERATGRGRTVTVDVPVLVLGGPGWDVPTAGRRVVAVGRLRPTEPGEEVVALLAASGPPRAMREGAWWWQAADRLRAGLTASCAELSEDAGGLLPSLVVGDTTRLPTRLADDLRTAGLTHLTAVSGANIAIAAGAALWTARGLGAGRRARLVAAALMVVGFVIVARPQPSVLRAAVMGCVGLAGMAAARPARGVPALCVAGIGLLVVDPWLARSPGFALSCTASAGLLLLAPLWTERLARRLPRALAAALAVPAAAQAACGPVLVLLQPSVSTVSVPANLLAEPAVAPATLIGVATALAAPLWPWGASRLAWCGGWATGWIAGVAHTAAALPWTAVPWPSGVVGAVLLAGATAAVVVLTVRRRPDPAPGTSPPAVRLRRGIVAAGVAVLLVVGMLVAVRWVPWVGRVVRRAAPPGWLAAACDVGQGASLVVRSGPDRAVVVDTGPDPAAVDRCLADLGVRHVDLLVLTHFHADHVGGLTGVLNGRDVGPVLRSPLARPAGGVRDVEQALGGHPLTVPPAGARGAVQHAGWRTAWDVLGPPTSPAAPAAGTGEDEGTVVNDASLACLLTVEGPAGHVRVLGLGDLEVAGQRALLPVVRARVGVVDVVQVSHHGSARQWPPLYAAARPRVALVGVGAGNDYGHPAPATLSMLARLGATVFRTDLAGRVAVAARDDGGLDVVTSRRG